MADDAKEETLNEAEQETAVESSATEQTDQPETQAEESTQDNEETQDSSAQETKESPEEKEGKRDRSANGRIRELLKENKELKENPQVTEQFKQSTPEQQKRFSQMLEGREDVTPQELDNLANQYLNQNLQQLDRAVDLRLEQRLSQERARQTLEADIQALEKNEVLQEDSELEETIVGLWRDASNARFDSEGKLISYNPNVRLADFAEKQLKLIEKRTERGRAADKATLSQQADESAVAPSAKSKPEKAAEEKSIAELEKELGFVNE